MQTHIGVDLHQRFCYLTAVDASGKTLKQSQVANPEAALRAWLRQVPAPRQVVVEASGFWPAFARAVEPEAERLVMVHPQRMKAIASARLKNDQVDSQTLLQVAQVAARCSPAAKAWYLRLKRRKPAQVALIALARKLPTAVWALLRHGLCFDESAFAERG